MSTYAVDVRLYIPANDESEVHRTIKESGVSDSEYYSHHDIVDVEENEE